MVLLWVINATLRSAGGRYKMPQINLGVLYMLYPLFFFTGHGLSSGLTLGSLLTCYIPDNTWGNICSARD